MKVFKFGGASVKDADGVRNLAQVLELHKNTDLAIVVSAMGKTTDALEQLTKAYFYKEGDAFQILNEVKAFHREILTQLFKEATHPIFNEVNNSFVEIEWVIEDAPIRAYDFEYDQIVSIGEMVSTKIVSAYLNEMGLANRWWDVRDFVQTDNTYREGRVDFKLSKKAADGSIGKFFANHNGPKRVVTQGFIGVTSENFTTTLGREGSDFTGAIIAYLLEAESLTIWKDVPGVLNADPKWFDDTVKLNNISYHEAVELAYYGATIIHPKTIKPLRNKSIPLYVRSFVSPEQEGTTINENMNSDELIPSFIFCMDQVLISISPKDYSFIAEHNLGHIFGLFAEHRITINLMQNSAISFSVCINNDPTRVRVLLRSLEETYAVKYNEALELVTVRHYDQATLDRVTLGKKILIEQKSRSTARLVMHDTSR